MYKINISVVIPVYNAEKTIITCLSSVISELNTLDCEWEVITVDDGSQDNSSGLIDNFIKENNFTSKIKYCYQKNMGAGAARNKGIKSSNGDFIAFNDSDDMWVEGKLKKQMEVFNQYPDVVMVGGLHDVININSVWYKEGECSLISLKDLIYKFYFTTPGVMFRKEILIKSGLFNSTQRNAEEGLFFYRISYFGKCILVNQVFSKNVLGKSSWGESGLSSQIHKQSRGELKNLYVIHKEGLINIKDYIFATVFSLLKYLRRILIYYYYRINKLYREGSQKYYKMREMKQLR